MSGFSDMGFRSGTIPPHSRPLRLNLNRSHNTTSSLYLHPLRFPIQETQVSSCTFAQQITRTCPITRRQAASISSFMAIPYEHPASPAGSNQDLNTRVFLSVAITVAVIMVLLLLAVQKGNRVIPAPTQTTTSGPNSQLSPIHASPTSGPVRVIPKPSPLHLRAPTKPARHR